MSGCFSSPSWLVWPAVHFSSPSLGGLASIPLILQFDTHLFSIVFCFLLYPLLGWLFGSYTVLSWPRLAFPVLLQRIFITSAVTFIVAAFARWIVNPGEEVWILDQRVHNFWLCSLTAWSLLVRIALRRGLLSHGSPRLLLLAADDELPNILAFWSRIPLRQRLEPIGPPDLERLLDESSTPLLVALSSGIQAIPPSRPYWTSWGTRPRFVQTLSPISLFERHQERLLQFC